VQTYTPEHFALACCVRHDYKGFAQQELQLREELGYPPFGFLVNCVFSGVSCEQVEDAAQGVVDELLEPAAKLGIEVLGPAPCPLARLRGKSRYQILLKASTRPPLRHLLTRLPVLRRALPGKVLLTVDVDPLDML
jgi:primosomal protein N' (replication factor Y)